MVVLMVFAVASSALFPNDKNRLHSHITTTVFIVWASHSTNTKLAMSDGSPIWPAGYFAPAHAWWSANSQLKNLHLRAAWC
jgi:hypothetical protein